ncbi:MAG: heterodisulfide reductase-related iron-sulfur binding cluster [Bacteroidales bacterium]|nr:heterodisulfide reductase-related iron-sulfur binding cluster [Bacteroidales bacterium]
MNPLSYSLPLQAAPEVIDRIPSGYSNFVIPFVVGISFMLIWLTVGLIRLLAKIPADDRRRFWKSLITPKIALKNIKDLFCDCLFHTKIWKRKPLLGYMHSSIAFGWFMLIVLGHIEVALFVPKHLAWTDGGLFYPIFYRFFVWINPGHVTLRGWFFFFLMDFFLLYVLTGVGMAIFKRFRSIVLGMRHTTKPSLADRVALYSLWMIFPLRLLAESFTADLSGGSFLTVPVNHLWHWIFGDKLFFMPVWWAYSICLGLFFAAMPFSRYMHILTEVLWILLRNAGIQPRHPRKGVAEAEIYACSSCGLCLDACPMNVQKKNLKYSSVYFIRFLRRHNEKKINAIADKCLMCDKCHALCPVGVDAPALRRAQRATVNNSLPYDYSYLMEGSLGSNSSSVSACVAANACSITAGSVASTRTATAHALLTDPSPSLTEPVEVTTNIQKTSEDWKVMYFAGCMTHLTPRIIKSVEKVFKSAGVNYTFADRDGGICCGRPLMLAGKTDAAYETISANRKMILGSGCRTLVLSCPICYKIFKDEYALEGVEVLHYTQFIKRLVDEGKLKLTAGDERIVYHDPCELGRGCGVYKEPREVLAQAGTLVKATKEGDESICCGGSLGSLTLDTRDRAKITESSVGNLLVNNPQTIVTACPLCLKTFSESVPETVKVQDFAETVSRHL